MIIAITVLSQVPFLNCDMRQDCRLSICSHFGWVWQILSEWYGETSRLVWLTLMRQDWTWFEIRILCSCWYSLCTTATVAASRWYSVNTIHTVSSTTADSNKVVKVFLLPVWQQWEKILLACWNSKCMQLIEEKHSRDKIATCVVRGAYYEQKTHKTGSFKFRVQSTLPTHLGRTVRQKALLWNLCPVRIKSCLRVVSRVSVIVFVFGFAIVFVFVIVFVIVFVFVFLTFCYIKSPHTENEILLIACWNAMLHANDGKTSPGSQYPTLIIRALNVKMLFQRKLGFGPNINQGLTYGANFIWRSMNIVLYSYLSHF